MEYLLTDIARIISAKPRITENNGIEHILLDSRKVYTTGKSIFFALKSSRRNGHQFIPELYKKGIRNFIVAEEIDSKLFPEGNFLQVDDSLAALQQLTAYHRKRFSIPVIGITGSNGKTIVKEWLYHLLHEDHNIVRGPKSYNSQVGVPLSVWLINEQHELGIFEAGISLPGEMEKLQKIISPDLGVLTNIREAHNEGFSSMKEKALEKIKLFLTCRQIVYGKDHLIEDFDFEEYCKKNNEQKEISFYSWSSQSPAWLTITNIEKRKNSSIIHGRCEHKEISVQIPFTDDASIENAITCWTTVLAMGLKQEEISKRMKGLFPVDMRLELKKGINHCTIINDSYSADIDSLEIALNFLDQQAGHSNKTVILSDFLQTGLPPEKLYDHIFNAIKKHGIKRIIGVGEQISTQLQKYIPEAGNEINIELFGSTDQLLKQFRSSQYKEETILIKGARVFGFERIVSLLEQKLHQTILEVNLSAVLHNLKEYQKFLDPSTKLMAMVKAFAYGSGGAEIAGFLQFHKVDYLAVAYADEGVELRKAGITMPVMIMNPEENAFETIVEYNLEPEIFSFDTLDAFDNFLKNEGLTQYPVHIEIETGMNRLGFAIGDIQKLAKRLNESPMKVQSVFSHLASSEDPKQDEFTNRQFNDLKQATDELEKKLGYSFLRHISNSAAIVRHPQLQMDMVRLGIGLYGIDTSGSKKLQLQPVATLKSTIAQLKKLKKGETVSYNRTGLIKKDSLIATIRLGYADGYPRRLGNGKGKVLINGKQAPVVGTVCMDMIMADVTNIPRVKEGDEVIIFGEQLPVQMLAEWAGTIPYEIMTGISQRVKRVFYEE